MKHRIFAAVCLIAFAAPLASAQVAVEVYKQLAPSVVKFSTTDGDGVGTGFVIHPDGIILTNRHVAGAASAFHIDVEYRDAEGNKKFAKYKKVDARFRLHPDYDMAICRIDPNEHPDVKLVPVRFFDGELLPGMHAHAIGHPRGGDKSITSGAVTSPTYREHEDDQPHVGTTVIVQGGNSGGPMVNDKGEVIGIATFVKQDPRGFGALTYCVPRTAWKDFSVFTTWKAAKGNPKQAKRIEKFADERLKQLDEYAGQVGRDNPQITELTGQVAQLYARALAADPGSTRLMIKVARMLIKFDQKPRAIAMLIQAIDIDPWAQPDAYGLLAIAMTGVEKPTDQVLVAAEEGIAKFPRNALAWVGKGEYHGVVKKDWEEAMLWEKVGYDLYSTNADLVSKSLIEDTYSAARSKLKEAGGREPHPQEIAGIMKDKIEPAVGPAKKAKESGTRFINSAFEQLIEKFMPEPPPEVADDFDLNKMMAEYAAAGGPAAPPIATPTPPTPTPQPLPPAPAPKDDADTQWIKSKMGLAKMYWGQKAQRPDLGVKALKVLKQIDYRFPKDPRADEARALMTKWSSE